MDPWKTGSGQLVADRFELERLVRQSRLGALFRARDGQTGKTVAFRMLRLSGALAEAGVHLEQEMQRIAGFHHPGLAPHIAHGRLAPQEFFVATEWIEGEDLGGRLARKPLRVAESLELARAVAATLAIVHERGLVYGELKPSRLLLRGGALQDVVLLGLGLPHSNLSARTITRSGELVATLRYVAPELLRGRGRPGPQADIFALGCVLFECLTGAPPFAGEHVGSILAQLLYGEAPRLGQVRPELPEALETLLGRMLTPSVGERIAQGRELLAALAAIEVPPALGEMIPAHIEPPPLARGEQRLVSLVLGFPPTSLQPARDEATEQATDTPLSQSPGANATDTAVGRADLDPQMADLGVRIDALADGSLLLTLSGWDVRRQTATDQAVQAARAAQRLQGLLPAWQVAVATGRGMSTGPRTLGEALHRATTLLADEAARPGTVWLDELTAELLDTRFQTRAAGNRWALGEERRGAEEIRLLLGRPTPCVGREQELRLLSSLVAGVAEEPQARAVLVLGPSGMGKSRLRQELVRRLWAERSPVKVAVARADALHAGTPHGLIAQAVRELCGLPATGTEAERRALLGARIQERVPPGDAERVLQFLGELCGLPFPDDESPQLRAARQDPRLLSDQVEAAVLTLLRAECGVQPVLLVLEDLHWSDEASVRLVEAALRQLEEQPFIVLGLARPEIKERFPRLWQDSRVQEMYLGGLGRKASEQLVRTVLGKDAPAQTVDRIVEQAGGHALFLEELIRAVAEGAEELPETVLAMLQARLLRLEDRARRMLTAASVFGDRFWRGGLVALLGADGQGDGEVERCLQLLVSAETIARQRESRLPGEEEYAFRHVLVREAAYGLLVEEDRRAGHHAAARYLERAGEREPMVLAEHYLRGGEMTSAALFFARAATVAVKRSDLAGALRCVERGLGCQASGEVEGTLRAAAAWAHFWRWEFQPSYEMACQALPMLAPGSEPWCRAVGAVLVTAFVFGQSESVVEYARTLAATRPLPGAEGVFLEQLLSANSALAVLRRRADLEALLMRHHEVEALLGGNERRARGLVHVGDALYYLMIQGDPWQYRAAAEAALACFLEAGDQRYEAIALGHIGLARTLLGEAAGALPQLRAVLARCKELGEVAMEGLIEAYIALALLEGGQPGALAEAEALAQAIIAGNPLPTFWSGLAWYALSRVRAARGELAPAEEAARQALATVPVVHASAAASLGRILLARGAQGEARAVFEEALARLMEQGGTGFGDIELHLGAAEARHARGEDVAARQALDRAAERLAERASRILDVEVRERYLHGVRDNLRVSELRRLWAQATPSSS
ncbi:MAG TPA: AAA family ATPase [Polyangia bacterium]|jgi:tetratricopeptide (TPR) repeat protein|nr:AAA family ATPase [Polyangia bacterium]